MRLMGHAPLPPDVAPHVLINNNSSSTAMKNTGAVESSVIAFGGPPAQEGSLPGAGFSTTSASTTRVNALTSSPAVGANFAPSASAQPGVARSNNQEYYHQAAISAFERGYQQAAEQAMMLAAAQKQDAQNTNQQQHNAPTSVNTASASSGPSSSSPGRLAIMNQQQLYNCGSSSLSSSPYSYSNNAGTEQPRLGTTSAADHDSKNYGGAGPVREIPGATSAAASSPNNSDWMMYSPGLYSNDLFSAQNRNGSASSDAIFTGYQSSPGPTFFAAEALQQDAAQPGSFSGAYQSSVCFSPFAHPSTSTSAGVLGLGPQHSSEGAMEVGSTVLTTSCSPAQNGDFERSGFYVPHRQQLVEEDQAQQQVSSPAIFADGPGRASFSSSTAGTSASLLAGTWNEQGYGFAAYDGNQGSTVGLGAPASNIAGATTYQEQQAARHAAGTGGSVAGQQHSMSINTGTAGLYYANAW
ncbi:unnamed protein product [Amoebophrya sp. A120]|nr:unnamed protein product [Amoebophrya sp. A120]|eukprot:GSA120T00013697001.1